MIKPAFDFFEKFINEFSWRRLSFTIIIIVILIGCLVSYETYTGNFQLKRLKKSVEILRTITNLSDDIKKSNNKNIANIFKSLIAKLEMFINHNSIPFNLPTWVLKGFTTLVPWLLIALLIILSSDGNYKKSISGVIVVAIPSAVIGIALPDYEFSQINYLIYPIGITVFIFVFVAIYHAYTKQL